MTFGNFRQTLCNCRFAIYRNVKANENYRFEFDVGSARLLFIFDLTFIWKIKIFPRAEVGGRSARLFISFNFQSSSVLILRVQADTGLIESGNRVSRKIRRV